MKIMSPAEARKAVDASKALSAVEKMRLDAIQFAIDEGKANNVMDLFALKLDAAIKAEKYKFVLFKLTYSDYRTQSGKYNYINEGMCAPWVQILCDKIKQTGYVYNFEYQHDGVGVESWFNIEVLF